MTSSVVFPILADNLKILPNFQRWVVKNSIFCDPYPFFAILTDRSGVTPSVEGDLTLDGEHRYNVFRSHIVAVAIVPPSPRLISRHSTRLSSTISPRILIEALLPQEHVVASPVITGHRRPGPSLSTNTFMRKTGTLTKIGNRPHPSSSYNSDLQSLYPL
ncbi:hypothetical protein BDM02DRAFT_2679688 [Thelephora ganbajun]|uniref:Uncharacterized protein n=1 Tax=Thelephora ganbajun TaxID=370292 RepID=A0ACB6ZCW6_THEGA|nr:hypothetical protein BDM02DRAFT_2679688 [Thelephora ganbajun]